MIENKFFFSFFSISWNGIRCAYDAAVVILYGVSAIKRILIFFTQMLEFVDIHSIRPQRLKNQMLADTLLECIKTQRIENENWCENIKITTNIVLINKFFFTGATYITKLTSRLNWIQYKVIPALAGKEASERERAVGEQEISRQRPVWGNKRKKGCFL